MTEQPKEYIITETGMNLAIAALKANRLYDTAESVLKEIRPVSTPPEGAAPNPRFSYVALESEINDLYRLMESASTGYIRGDYGKERLDKIVMRPLWQHDAAIAQAAEEKVLDAIIVKMDKADSDGFANMPHAKEIVNSFRQHKEQP